MLLLWFDNPGFLSSQLVASKSMDYSRYPILSTYLILVSAQVLNFWEFEPNVLKFHVQKCKKMAVIFGYFSHICSIFLLIEDLCLKNKNRDHHVLKKRSPWESQVLTSKSGVLLKTKGTLAYCRSKITRQSKIKNVLSKQFKN